MTADPADPSKSKLDELMESVARIDERTALLMHDRVAAARERQEQHGILIDVLARLGKVEAAAVRVPIIEKTLWELEAKRIEKIGAAKFIGRMATRARILWTLAGGAILAVLQWLFGWWPPGWPKP